MKLEDALLEWGYKITRANLKALQRICKAHPGICVTISPLNIKNRTKKLYLPDRRTKDTYVHIVRAIKNNAHLFPDIIDLTDTKLKEQLRQLCNAGIIEKSNGAKTNATEDYNTTLKTENWLNKRKYQRLKEIIKILEPLKPEIGQHITFGQT